MTMPSCSKALSPSLNRVYLLQIKTRIGSAVPSCEVGLITGSLGKRYMTPIGTGGNLFCRARMCNWGTTDFWPESGFSTRQRRRRGKKEHVIAEVIAWSIAKLTSKSRKKPFE